MNYLLLILVVAITAGAILGYGNWVIERFNISQNLISFPVGFLVFCAIFQSGFYFFAYFQMNTIFCAMWFIAVMVFPYLILRK